MYAYLSVCVVCLRVCAREICTIVVAGEQHAHNKSMNYLQKKKKSFGFPQKIENEELTSIKY